MKLLPTVLRDGLIPSTSWPGPHLINCSPLHCAYSVAINRTLQLWGFQMSTFYHYNHTPTKMILKNRVLCSQSWELTSPNSATASSSNPTQARTDAPTVTERKVPHQQKGYGNVCFNRTHIEAIWSGLCPKKLLTM